MIQQMPLFAIRKNSDYKKDYSKVFNLSTSYLTTSRAENGTQALLSYEFVTHLGISSAKVANKLDPSTLESCSHC